MTQKYQPIFLNLRALGLAYTVISRRFPLPEVEPGVSRLASIVQHGLLGTEDKTGRSDFGKNTTKKEFDEARARGEKLSLFFHIIGRLHRDFGYNNLIPDYDLEGERYKRRGRYRTIDKCGLFAPHTDNVGVVFDISSFTEGSSLISGDEGPIGEEGVYRAYNHRARYQQGQALTYDEYGFVMSSMVPREEILAIVFNMTKRLPDWKIRSKIQKEAQRRKGIYGWDYKIPEQEIERMMRDPCITNCEETDSEKLMQRAEELWALFYEHNDLNTEQVIPIYDTKGNMWLPREIRYERVLEIARQKVSERLRKGLPVRTDWI